MTVGDFQYDPHQWTWPQYYEPMQYIYPTTWTYPTTRKVVTEKFYDKKGNLVREVVTETFSSGQTYGVSSTTDKIQIDGTD